MPETRHSQEKLAQNIYSSLEDLFYEYSLNGYRVSPEEFWKDTEGLEENEKSNLTKAGIEATWTQITEFISQLKELDPNNYKQKITALVGKKPSRLTNDFKKAVLNHLKLN